MQIKKIIFSLILIFSCKVGFCDSDYVTLAIPKSGTYLLGSVLKNCYTIDFCGYYHPTELSLKRRSDSFFYNKKVIVNIRDPRDILISAIDWSEKHYHASGNWVNWEHTFNRGVQRAQYFSMTYKERLLALIRDDQTSSPYEKGFFKHHFEDALYIIEKYDAFVTRFEDLVGPRGNGSYEKQLETLTLLKDYLETDFNGPVEDAISKAFDTGTTTFFKGKIGRWKEYFDDEIMEEFEKYWGQYMIDFGYEM